MTSATLPSPRRVVVSCLMAILALLIIRTAWVCDDAYLTFRTVDNVVHGFGPRWNVAERVQAYTHPLWMMALSVVYFFTREIYFTSLALSVILTMTAAWLVTARGAADAAMALVAAVALASSKAFMDYSTSGLENPLTAVLVVLFFLAWMRRPSTPRELGWLSLLAALVTLNRMDAILITLPALAVAALRARPRAAAARAVAIGFAPFVVWELFSLVYYGFLFPNTAYAKLGASLARADLIAQGLLYFANSINSDPVTLSVCAAAVLLPLAWSPARRFWPVAAGLVLELVYAVSIGGDFMSGRLFAAPFLVSVLVLSAAVPAPGRAWPAALVLVAGLGLCARYPAVLTDAGYGLNRPDIMDAAGISDERAYYYQTSGLLTVARDKVVPNSHYIKAGMVMRFQLTDQPTKVIVDQHAGFYGFSAGPKLHIIDPYALGDPLLARLPAETPWRIGHFKRAVPEGYPETVQTGTNQIRDVNLAMFYEKLLTVVKAPLFSRHRLSTILKMNTARYNGLIKAYLANLASKSQG